MKALILAFVLTLTSSAFASALKYTCVSGEAGVTLAITENEVIAIGKVFDSYINQSQMDLKQTVNGLLVGVATEDFYVQILDNDKKVLPGVLMLNDKDLVQLKCVRE